MQVYATNISFFHETLFIYEKSRQMYIYDYKCSWLNYLKIKIHITLSLPGKFLQKNHWHCIPYKFGQKYSSSIWYLKGHTWIRFLWVYLSKALLGNRLKHFHFRNQSSVYSTSYVTSSQWFPQAPLEEKVPPKNKIYVLKGQLLKTIIASSTHLRDIKGRFMDMLTL